MSKGITLQQFTSGVKTVKTELDQKILACEQAIEINSEADSKLKEELTAVKETIEGFKSSSDVKLFTKEW